MSKQRVLPADVYDALELSAIAHHGIGQPNVFTDMATFGEYGTKGCPVCILGHAAFVTNVNTAYNAVANALRAAEINGGLSDEIVRRINARRKVSQYTRVSWRDYCAELNIARSPLSNTEPDK